MKEHESNTRSFVIIQERQMQPVSLQFKLRVEKLYSMQEGLERGILSGDKDTKAGIHMRVGELCHFQQNILKLR